MVLLFSHLIDVNYQRMHKFEYGISSLRRYPGRFGELLLIAEPHLSGTILIVGLGVIYDDRGRHPPFPTCFGGGRRRNRADPSGPRAEGQMGPYDGSRIEHWLNPFLDPGARVPDSSNPCMPSVPAGF